jgi:hypothetical protein
MSPAVQMCMKEPRQRKVRPVWTLQQTDLL